MSAEHAHFHAQDAYPHVLTACFPFQPRRGVLAVAAFNAGPRWKTSTAGAGVGAASKWCRFTQCGSTPTRAIHLSGDVAAARRPRAVRSWPAERPLKRELYGANGMPTSATPYRYDLAEEDTFEPPNLTHSAPRSVLGWYDSFPIRKLPRRRSASAIPDYAFECNRDTSHSRRSTALLNAMAASCTRSQPGGKSHAAWRASYYRWGDDTRGPALRRRPNCTWDTGFAVEALLANPQAARDHREARFCERLPSSSTQKMRASVAPRDRSFPMKPKAAGVLGRCRSAWPVHVIAPAHNSAAILVNAQRPRSARTADAGFALVRRSGLHLVASEPRRRRVPPTTLLALPLWLERLNPAKCSPVALTDQSYVE